ncbi:MAG: tetratricopeptide repeat protein [Methylophilaceae bacterium]
MSLLIKALDKAQAEKAQVKVAVSKKEEVKSKSDKPVKSKSVKTTQVLSLEENIPKKPKVGVAAGKAGDSQLGERTKSLKGSTVEVPQQSAPAKTTTITDAVNSDTKIATGEAARMPAQAQAANVFTAKQAAPPKQIAKLALIIGIVALGVMGALAYWYQSIINVPDIVIPPKPVVNQEMPEPLPELTAVNERAVLEEPEIVEPEMMAGLADPVITPMPEVKPLQENVAQAADKAIKKQKESEPTLMPNRAEPAIEETLTVNETIVDTNTSMAHSSRVSADLGIASESASIKVTQKKTASGVNPILMRAYDAYNAGNDAQARQDYKQVLKRYGPNVDAMLGLGAIATRQSRIADANGWYRRVLEVEPRNEVAKAGLLNIQQERQPQRGESHIKSMLATTPSDANLHAALGDLYANQGAWPAAQSAYFNAYRFNPSAENAFNLGVSLDQLGKSKVALPYYQEALQKAGQSRMIDAVALKARISSIE